MTTDKDKLANHKFDASEYITDPSPRPCCIERDSLKERLAIAIKALEFIATQNQCSLPESEQPEGWEETVHCYVMQAQQALTLINSEAEVV